MSLDATSRETKLTRDPSVDMIRCFAFVLVVSVHFFLVSGVYSLPVDSKTMFAVCMMRSFCVICVPLFMILTGYLQKNKRPGMSYFIKIIQVLTVYVLCSLINIAFTNIYGPDHDTPMQVVMKILNFKGAKYAWYVEMYITLFLASPYINLIWKGLEDRRSRRILIGISCLVSLAPAIMNIWRFSSLGWWLTPSSSNEYVKLIPAWFKNLYPFTYYLIGCYLAEYKVRFKRWKCVCGAAALTLAAGCFNYWRSRPGKFVSGEWANYASPFTALIAVLVFVFFLSWDYRKMPSRVKAFLKVWASVTLGAYLLSRISDVVIYDQLAAHISYPGKRLVWILVTVPLSAAASCIMSWIVNLLAVPLSNKLTSVIWRVTAHFNIVSEE